MSPSIDITQVGISRVGILLHKYLSGPRTILFMFGVLMFAIVFTTWKQSPDYLVFPNLYIVTGSMAGIASWWAMIRPGKWNISLAGGLIAGGLAARGIGLSMTVLRTEWRGDVSLTLMVGSVAYLTIMTMLPPIWLKHIIPWTVDRIR